MMIIQQIAFIIISGIAIFLFSKKVMEIRRNILLGKEEDLTKTTFENIIKLTRGYLDYDNTLLYRLYIYFNPNLPEDEKQFYQNKIASLIEM